MFGACCDITVAETRPHSLYNRTFDVLQRCGVPTIAPVIGQAQLSAKYNRVASDGGLRVPAGSHELQHAGEGQHCDREGVYQVSHLCLPSPFCWVIDSLS